MDYIEYKNIQKIKEHDTALTKGVFGTDVPLWILILIGAYLLLSNDKK